MVKRRPLNVFSLFKSYFGTSSESLKGHFILPPEQDRLCSYIEEQSRLAHLRVALHFVLSSATKFVSRTTLGGDVPWHHALPGALDGYVYV